MMWGWPLPAWFEDNHIAMGLVQLLLAGIVMVINQKFFISGFKSLWHRSPNMDTLVAMGSMASFLWSVYVLFAMTRAQVDGNMEAVMDYMMDFYFESAAMILTLITVGKMLEARSKGKTTDALKGLMNMAPKTAVLVKGEKEVTVPIEQVEKGDIFVVRPGESIPVDGKILEGHSAVNEAALTGESIPVDKEEGDLVSAATINQSGVFVPVVILIAVVTTIVWLLAGQNVGYALARGISVLVISCPCALGLATPVAIMVGNGMGAKNGILFKTAVSLEEAGRVQIVALDKTGTITSGEPRVTDLVCESGYDEKALLELAGALEKKSEHPLAKAVLLEIAQRKIATKEVEDFQALAGNGLTGILEGHRLLGGSMKYISSQVTVGKQVKNQAQILAKQGKTPLLFAKDDVLIGMIAVADVIKEDSPKAVQELQNMGIRVVMLTGDNEQTAKAIGAQAGVDQVIAGVLPDGKEAVIRKLKEYGKVAMVGDGINDAPALTRADIGIAIGAGADVAIDAADVVLMKSRLSDVPAAVRLSRATLRNIHENLFWAFFYNIIGIPLAAGVWIPIFGWTLNPMFGALAMSLSSFCVVSNALRLNLFKVKDSHRDHKIKNEVTLPQWEASKGEKNMTKTMTIKGMMCGHCEARVKKTLEELEHVTEAQVSHEKGTAVVSMETEVADEVLKKAVEDQGYQVENIQ